ncbi:MAG: endosialidase [Lachnospiraceae bacterium]|nr:endosialidase [Lachnospiraceae bacterium]
MGVVEELIRKEEKGTLSFGNYLLDTKTKKGDFKFEGATYKIKTFREITKLERNGALVYESVPGSTVTNFKGNSEVVEFDVEAAGDISFTLEMEPSKEYKLVVDGVSAGRIPTNVGGKLNASLELNEGSKISVKIVKC